MGAVTTSRQAAELDFSFERNGFTAELVKKMSEGDFLTQVRLVLIGAATIVIKSILEFVGTIKLPATTEKFVAREKFIVNTSDEAEVKIWALGNNFKAWFLNKVEEPVEESELRVQRLKERSADELIIAELGGSKKAKIFLSQLWRALEKKQAKGEKGGWHIAYVEDKVRFSDDEPFAYDNEKGVGRSVLRAVIFDWSGDGWGLGASQVSYPYGWDGGSLLLSSNSSKP